MHIIEECNVIKVKGDYAIIELTRKPECEGCKACAFNRRNTIRMTAKCETSCLVGDKVMVEMPEKSVKGSWLILFVLPLVLLLASVLITASSVWYIQLVSIAAALLLGLCGAMLCDFAIRRHSKFIPTIKNVVEENKKFLGENQ